MKKTLRLQFRLPRRYNSITEIIERRRDLRQLLDALEIRETELLEERRSVKLTPYLVQSAEQLHDARCVWNHNYPPGHRYQQCILKDSSLWKEILSDPSAAEIHQYDQLWPWIILADKVLARL